MIKASELRIGSLVQLTGQDCYYTICMIEESGSLYFKECPEIHYDLEDDPVQGIPLTEEWLAKLGIEKRLEYWEPFVGDAKGAWFQNGDISIIRLKKTGKFYRAIATNGDEFGYIQGPEIVSVHQLQNLFFALTGEELTLKESA